MVTHRYVVRTVVAPFRVCAYQIALEIEVPPSVAKSHALKFCAWKTLLSCLNLLLVIRYQVQWEDKTFKSNVE